MSKGQDTVSLYTKFYNLPDKLFNGIDSKTSSIEKRITNSTERYLRKLEREEKKLRRRVAKKDSSAANEIFGDIDKKYSEISGRFLNGGVNRAHLNSIYSGHVDSMKVVLNLFQKSPSQFLPPATKEKIDGALKNFQSVQDDLAKAQDIRKLLKERQRILEEQLDKFGLSRQLKEFKKQVYYYRAQMDEYKQMLNDPSKLERKALQLASKSSIFKDFFSKYSDLAKLFAVPDDYGSITSLQGLQTRVDVQRLIQQRIAAGGPNAQQIVEQNIQQAQSELSQLKNKLNQLGKGSSDADMPDFKPNNQKTKTFRQRLEFGSNLQTARGNYYFPATTDIGLSVGYKLNDKSIIGVGGSYKLGLGKDWNHIDITHEGIGLRSFIDYKLRGTFYLSGGFEYNYQQPFESIQQLTESNDWHQSGLIGLSKILSINNKFLKKSKVQLLWDFLSYQQNPPPAAFKFRFGFNF